MNFPEQLRRLPRPYGECPEAPAPGESVQVGYFHVERRAVTTKDGRPRYFVRNFRGVALAMGRRWRWCLDLLGAYPDDDPAPRRNGEAPIHWSKDPKKAARAAAQRREFALANRPEPPPPEDHDNPETRELPSERLEFSPQTPDPPPPVRSCEDREQPPRSCEDRDPQLTLF